MKSTGIVRRVDDLGRVVIPKAIREQLAIKDGDPLEIFTEGGAVVYKKYYDNTILEMLKDIQDYLEKGDYSQQKKEKLQDLIVQAKCVLLDAKEVAE